MSVTRNTVRLYSAVVLLVGLLIVLVPFGTGLPVHEWASLIVIIPLLVHIVIDWQWIVTATARAFKAQPGATRFNYLLDWLLFILITVVTVSGLLISEAALPAIGIRIEVDPFWSGVHIVATRFLMMLLGVHIAVHVDWIVSALRRDAIRAPARTMAGDPARETQLRGRFKPAIAPTLIVLSAAAAVALAMLPFANAEWAEGFRAAVSASLEAEVVRPTGFVTAATDLYWVAIIMGVPALITLGMRGIGRLLRTRR